MGFWGVEVKPGKKVSPYGAAANALGKLRITQATLGLGSSNEKSILQCFGERKNPIFLCTLLPDKIESCSLDLEFDEDDPVTFSVAGPRSIHLSGYFLEGDEADAREDGCGFDHFGEDIANMGSEESSDYDSEDAFEDDLTEDESYSDDDRFEVVPKSGVVIEEITDDDKAVNGDSQSKQQKKTKRRDSVEKPQNGQIVPTNCGSAPVLESEDEDGFPTSKAVPHQKSEATPQQPEKETTEKVQKKKKRDVKTIEQDDQPDRQKKSKKQKKLDKEGKNDKETGDTGTAAVAEDEKKRSEVTNGEADLNLPLETPSDNKENQTEKKKNKNKNKNKKSAEAGDQQVTTKAAEKSASTVTEEKPSQIRTFPNGLVVEELKMGKPAGKRAAPGKQVSVHYIGKLQKNGKIFDSNVGRAPFKFRLGIGQVIKGWDVGVNGMRVGDKRRLTIPPAMGYGAKGAGGQIPPNSWLVFDVELVDVR